MAKLVHKEQSYTGGGDTTKLMRYTDNAVLGAKNLLPNNATSQTVNGVTFTVNADGTVTANGTANANTWLWFVSAQQGGFYLPKGRYIINGCVSQASDAYNWQVYVTIAGSSTNLAVDWGHDTNGAEFENTSESNQLISSIWIRSGAVLNNLVFKPMIRLATDTDDTYVPYAMTNRELTEKHTAPIISGNVPVGSALGSGWTTIKTVNLNASKRYLVIWQVLFANTGAGYKAVAFNAGEYTGQVGVEAGGTNLITTWIFEGRNSIDLLAYSQVSGTVAGNYQIIEL